MNAEWKWSSSGGVAAVVAVEGGWCEVESEVEIKAPKRGRQEVRVPRPYLCDFKDFKWTGVQDGGVDQVAMVVEVLPVLIAVCNSRVALTCLATVTVRSR